MVVRDEDAIRDRAVIVRVGWSGSDAMRLIGGYVCEVDVR